MCSPGLTLGPLHSGSSICSLCGDILEALKETVCSCIFYSVLTLSGPAPYSSKTTALLLALQSASMCQQYARGGTSHQRPRGNGPVTFADCPFLMVLLQEGHQPGA